MFVNICLQRCRCRKYRPVKRAGTKETAVRCNKYASRVRETAGPEREAATAGKACGHTGGYRPTPFFFSIASRAIARIRSVSRTERSSFSQKNETICESELSKKLLITEFIKLRVYASLATSGR